MPAHDGSDFMKETTMTSEGSIRYPGWGVAAAAFVGVMVSFAAVVPYTFSLFLDPLHAAFGWQREAISNGFAIAALTVAAVSPGIGMLLDRLPPRRVILPSIIIFALALASLSRLHGPIRQFYLSFFVLGVVGNGTAQLAYSRAVLTWFQQRRGLALALTLTGSGTGSILIPPIAQYVIHHYGWRNAYLTLGGIALLGFPLTAALVRNRQSAAAAEDRSFATGSSVTSALRTPSFWILAVIIALAAFGANGLISHLAAILTERGISGQSAAVALSVLGATGIAGRLLTGALLDRFFAPFVTVAVLVLAACGTALLATATTAAAAFAGTALLGFSLGSEADVAPYLIARYFGRRNFSTLYGLTWTAYAVGGATGPMVVGHLYDRFGHYQPRFVFGLACTYVIGAALCFLLPRYPAAGETTDASDALAAVSASNPIAMEI